MGRLGVTQSLGGHVGKRPYRGARAGQVCVGGRVSEPEVHQVSEIVCGEQDIGRFDIAMDNLSAMRGIERSCDLAHDCHGPCRIQRALVGQDLLQIGAVDKPHVNVERTVDFPALVNRHHVRLPQPPGGTRLPV